MDPQDFWNNKFSNWNHPSKRNIRGSWFCRNSSSPLLTEVHWTSRTSGTSIDLRGVSYGNNTFVTVGGNGTILTSNDGNSWTSRISGIGDHLSRVTRGNGTFVAVGNSGAILTSSDEVMDNNSHVVGIETNQASLSINGSVTLKDNATISSDSGNVSLGNLDFRERKHRGPWRNIEPCRRKCWSKWID